MADQSDPPVDIWGPSSFFNDSHRDDFSEYRYQESEIPFHPTIKTRAPHVRARDEPPDPTASGPSSLDMEDWYAMNGWTVWEHEEDNPVFRRHDVEALPVEAAIEREVEVLRKALRKNVMRRRKAKAQAREARRAAAAAAAAAAQAQAQAQPVCTGNQASLRGGGGGGGDWDSDSDDDDEGVHHSEEMTDVVMTPVRRATGSIGSATPSTDGDGNPSQYLHTGDDPAPPPPRPIFRRGAPPPGAAADPPAVGKYTFGVEFEFLLAIKTRTQGVPDPHPTEDRWLSSALAGDPDMTLYEYTVKNRMADAMRRGGIVCNKLRDASETLWMSPRSRVAARLDFLSSAEPDVLVERATRAGYNDSKVGSSSHWTPPVCLWDANQDRDRNIARISRALVDSFEEYHKTVGVLLRHTGQVTIDAIATTWLVLGPMHSRLQGPGWNALGASDLRFHWRRRAMDRIAVEIMAWESHRHDPRHVEVSGMADKYRAWHATQDVSVSENQVRFNHYKMPAGYVRHAGDGFVDPPFVYTWWGGEVISPVYDINDPDGFATVRRAAAQLRNELRIHKPMSSVGSGLHVHLGHQDGFSLLQLKRLVTIWHAVEEDMYSLHRMDRYTGIYCTAMRTQSRLAMALFAPNNSDKNQNLEYLPNGGQDLADQYDRYMRPKLPLDRMDANTKAFVTNVWRYPTITNLSEAMGSGGITTMGLRFNLSGGKRTSRANFVQKQTLEFRQMQGTLDADHIHHWLAVCWAIVWISREYTDQQFHDILTQIYTKSAPVLSILTVPDLIQQYFQAHLDTSIFPGGRYYTYPDGDIVDWNQPFMVKGFGSTH